MGVLVDIVPNHVGVATPAQNPWWWSPPQGGPAVPLRRRRSTSTGTLAAAASGSPCWARTRTWTRSRSATGSCATTTTASRWPRAAIPQVTHCDDPREVHDRQHYELIGWRRADNELNYRRFFAVNSLAGIRVELPEVFDEAHAEVVRWFREGLVDGLRIDHPDGLADPEGYLRPAARGHGRQLPADREDPRAGREPAGRLRVRGHHRLRRPRGRGPGLRRRRRAGPARRARRRAARRRGRRLRGDDPRHQAPDHGRDPALGDAPAGAAGAGRRGLARGGRATRCPKSSPRSRSTAATCRRVRTS